MVACVVSIDVALPWDLGVRKRWHQLLMELRPLLALLLFEMCILSGISKYKTGLSA